MGLKHFGVEQIVKPFPLNSRRPKGAGSCTWGLNSRRSIGADVEQSICEPPPPFFWGGAHNKKMFGFVLPDWLFFWGSQKTPTETHARPQKPSVGRIFDWFSLRRLLLTPTDARGDTAYRPLDCLEIQNCASSMASRHGTMSGAVLGTYSSKANGVRSSRSGNPAQVRG